MRDPRGDGHGFTMGDVEMLRGLASGWERDGDHQGRLASLADRIEALLPPEKASEDLENLGGPQRYCMACGRCHRSAGPCPEDEGEALAWADTLDSVAADLDAGRQSVGGSSFVRAGARIIRSGSKERAHILALRSLIARLPITHCNEHPDLQAWWNEMKEVMEETGPFWLAVILLCGVATW
jgi:hypothetical protein